MEGTAELFALSINSFMHESNTQRKEGERERERENCIDETIMEENKTSYKAHVLVVPYPAQGHINPMLQFSKRLVSKGVKVTFATTIYLYNSMQKDQTSSLSSSSIDIETISDGHDESGFSQVENIDIYQEQLEIVGSRTLGALIEKLDGAVRRIDAVIYDGFIPWALDVAKKYGKMGAVFFTQTCAVNIIYYHVQRGLLKLPLPESKVSLPGLPLLEPHETPSFVYVYGSYPAFYRMVVDQFKNVDEADHALVSTFQELEQQGVAWISNNLWPLKTIGPTIPSMYLDKRLEHDIDYGMNLFKPNTDTCMTWLNQKSSGSVIYVSFGSMAQLSTQQMIELAWGLNQSRHHFLWIVRESEFPKLPKNFIDLSLDMGLVLTWCPQLEVLGHHSIGCFLTHCGFNSILEAICFAVPLIGMPQWTDQPTNAKYVEDVWKMGIRAKPNEENIITRDVIGFCIKEVMESDKGKEMKKNALKWSTLAKVSMEEGGSSDKNINEFVAKLVQ